MPDPPASAPGSLARRLARCGPYYPVALLFLWGLPLLTASRLGLALWKAERVAESGMAWGELLLQGVRADVVQVGLLAAPLALLAPLLGSQRTWTLWRRLAHGWVVLALLLLAYMEAATPGFVAQYDLRPNRIFVEYLRYPREVFTTLWEGHRLELLGSLLGTALFLRLATRGLRSSLEVPSLWRLRTTLLAFPVVVFGLFAGIRSTAGHRAVNPAYFATSGDALVNSLVINSTWSVVHAVYNLKHESKSSEIYGRLGHDEVLRLTGVWEDPSLAPPEAPTRRLRRASVERERPLNLVIVLEESLGATFVESLGGIPVTPNLERLSADGWWFENLYATGTRSVRGIEAVTCGFLPTPARSVVKLSLSQTGFFSLASLLGGLGYSTEFVYGGEAHFDNMSGFFSGNGFQRIIDQRDYVNPRFVATWGASDGDLLDKTLEQIQGHHERGEPFFTLAFTSSNHSPFEFPDGCIELYEPERATAANAVKYADHALGEFFDRARELPLWEDTLFLVVADHDIRAYGPSLVPIERFHIPGLILGGALEPRRITTVASQVDLAPTLLSLMGVTAEHPMVGRDLTQEDPATPGRAVMQFGDNYCLLEGSEAVILQPRHAATFASYDREAHTLLPHEPDDPERARRALAYALLPSWLYRERLYH